TVPPVGPSPQRWRPARPFRCRCSSRRARRSRSTRAMAAISAAPDAAMAEGPKLHMPARRRARKRALDVLFESDLRGAPIVDVLRAYVARLEQPRPAHLDYTITLVEGVAAHQSRIDELIVSYAEGWT